MPGNLAVITLSLLACLACVREAHQEVGSPQKKSVTSQANRPTFELKPGQQQNLREHVMALTLGEMRPSVITIVGSFDREDLLGPKKGLEWKCRILVYYVVKFDQTQGNLKDKQVELIFNRKDALVAIRSNVEGIVSRGDMSACR